MEKDNDNGEHEPINNAGGRGPVLSSLSSAIGALGMFHGKQTGPTQIEFTDKRFLRVATVIDLAAQLYLDAVDGGEERRIIAARGVIVPPGAGRAH